MRIHPENVIAITIGLVLLVASTMSGDWSPWAEGFFGTLAILLVYFSRQHVTFGRSWAAPERWMAFTVVIIGVTIFWSTNFYASGHTWILVLLGFVTFVGARAIPTEQRLAILKWFVVVTATGALWALVDQLRSHLDRAGGFLQNANALGGLLIIVLPVSTVLARRANGWQRWAWWCATVIIALTLIRTTSLTSMVALAVATVCFLVIFRKSVFQKRIIIRAALVFVALICSAMVLRSVQLHSVRQGIRLDRVISAQHFSTSFTQRWNFIGSAWRMLRDFPIVGLGLGTFQQNYPRYATTLFEQPRYVHNQYVEVAAESGVLSGIAFLGLIVSIVVYAMRHIRTALSQGEWWYPGLAFGILATSIHALFDFSWHFPAVWFSFWIFAGLTFERDDSVPSRKRFAPIILLIICSIVLLRALSVVVSFTPFQRGTFTLDNGQPQEAIENFKAGLRWDPDPYRRRQLVNALWLTAKGNVSILRDARYQADMAIRWARTDYNGYRIAARVSNSQKLYADANRLFREATRLDHFFHPDIYSEYMNFLIAQGRYADARVIGVEVQGQYTSSVWSSNPYVQSDLAVIRTLLQSIEGKQ